MEREKQKIVAAIILALGLTVAGFFPGYYFYKSAVGNNSVTVKGLSEMNVRADLAVWKLRFVVTGDDLSKAQQKVSMQSDKIKKFLLNAGFTDAEINADRTETTDLTANQYRSGNVESFRFILNRTITLKSNKVSLVEKTLPQTDNLIADGIIFDSSYEYPVSYMFTGLNKVKPQMLREATKNAREAAYEFAKSSGSKVGKIRRANQGVFSILPREQAFGNSESQQIEKTVRVVSTIEYWLE